MAIYLGIFEFFRKIINFIARKINMGNGNYNEKIKGNYIQGNYIQGNVFNVLQNRHKKALYWDNIQDSVVLITSANPDINSFGSGFIVNHSGSTSYVLTCAHVVRGVGGADQIMVDGIAAVQVVSGENKDLDLAVLKVDELYGKPPLELQASGEKGCPFSAVGFKSFDNGKGHWIKPLQGILGEQVGLKFKHSGERIKAWELNLTEGNTLESSFRGSPVIDENSGYVLGVVSYQEDEGTKGVAISIDSLERIWKQLNREQLYQVLLKLGYKNQVRAFLRLVQAQSVSAFLIHGSPDYGQRWLLNRLVEQYVPNSIAGKVVKIDFGRKVRRNDINSLWRELSNRVGLRTNKPIPSEIVERVYQCWKTQNVLLVFHDVNLIPESYLHKLVREFWRPLADRVREAGAHTGNSQLLMFLVDYEGSVANLDNLFSDKVDPRKLGEPVKTPKISEFSDEELADWIVNEFNELPIELTHEVDGVVRDILENSEQGIPEYVLAQICARSGFDWYEESEKWMKL
ncbi:MULTISPECIES: trypsin-like peptidase domain-containing protein [unclassified Moorena]|uniref:trypsin-like peptidase domain-containing protein n=1 Tax=unclassified Moorena TaxID=2683338 RepID=UPI0013CCFC02|nr:MULTISPECIES: trypsin-like peptidase domain-containing protein [unclassified Moorena]NEO23611.1 trypsin-like peptidase domain-containing protein [Moorena sp. SIO4A5]NEQ57731.1 trypsin-like peptidase domain-containing protein [Moorena sp. SIO4A1]